MGYYNYDRLINYYAIYGPINYDPTVIYDPANPIFEIDSLN